MIKKTAEFAHQKMAGECTGHDWWHVNRVWNLARYIQEKEGGDLVVIELAALLHDIVDWKFTKEKSSQVGARVAYDWVKQLNVDDDRALHVFDIVESISFKGAGEKNKIKTLEGKIVQDADRLDALGALGIARAFAYGGYKGNEIYDPDMKPHVHQNFDEYKDSKGTTVNHFYEKLLLLKDLMNTSTGKKLALERHAFMESYLEKFFKEWSFNG